MPKGKAEARTVENDVVRAQDVRIGCNRASAVPRANVVEPVVVDPSAVRPSFQISAHDGRIRRWNGQRGQPTILVGLHRNAAVDHGSPEATPFVLRRPVSHVIDHLR